MANKVHFGLSRCYYAVMNETGNTVTYGECKPMPGAVSLNLSPNGSVTNFAADNIYNYYASNGVAGFEGDLEMANIGDDFKKDVLGYLEDTNGVIYETANPISNRFALLFQFEGDAKAVRHVLYNCTATRVPINSQTTTDTKEPVTDTITITSAPHPVTNNVHGYKEEGTDQVYTGWFTQVYEIA